MTKKIIPQTLKGFRDFLPQESLKRQYVIDKLRAVFTLFGFEPLETPALEYAQILEGKYGREGEKLIYKFQDRGGRQVALRYDQTVPLARVIAQYQNEIPLPFKRYQIQPVWRADKPQKGRFREFLQCDADIVGLNSETADLEILSCLNACLKTLGFKEFRIEVNSRKIFALSQIDPQTITILDKEEKLGQAGVLNLLAQSLGSKEKAQKLYDSLKNSENGQIPSRLKKIIEKKEELQLVFNPLLARGLDYYTDLTFEVKIPNYQGGSICGGGRYDNLIGMFAGKRIPSVGFAFGFDRTLEAMEQFDLLPKKPTTTQVLVTIFSPELLEESIKVTSILRSLKVNTDLYLDPQVRLDKQLKYADKKGIPYTIIIGPDEVKNNQVTIKNLQTGEQRTISVSELKIVIK